METRFKEMVLEAPAKLNLYLNIVGKYSNGFHEIESVMQSIDLCDIVRLSVSEGDGIDVSCDDSNIPCDGRNIAYKAARAFLDYTGVKTKVGIDISKRIPYGAGLGGGSADGAAVLKGLSDIVKELRRDELIELGKGVGADIPFMLFGGTDLVGGIGESLNGLKSLPDCSFVVVKPNIGINTKAAYEQIDRDNVRLDGGSDRILREIENESLSGVADSLENIFEMVAPDEIKYIKSLLIDKGALGSLMTGSGSAVFGIFDDEERAQFAKRKMEGFYEGGCYCCRSRKLG